LIETSSVSSALTDPLPCLAQLIDNTTSWEMMHFVLAGDDLVELVISVRTVYVGAVFETKTIVHRPPISRDMN